MKKCPTCNRTYTDAGLSFCLEDGVPLLNVMASDPGLGGPAFDPNVTLHFEDPRDTNPPPTQMISPDQIPSLADMMANPSYQAPTPVAPPPPTPTIASYTGAPQPEPAWQPPPPVVKAAPVTPGISAVTPPPTPPKKSMLPWLIGGGLLLAVLAIGIVGVLVMASMSDSDNTNTANANNDPVKKEGPDKKPTPTPIESDGASFLDDFSENKWVIGANGNGSLYRDGMYIMQHSPADQFIANYGPEGSAGYVTNGASTVSVTAQALDSKPPQYGYGLVLHGGITNGKNLNGYAFLIDTGKKPQVSIVELRNSALTYIVKPKSAPMVLTGDAENNLEVKIDGKKMDFYVNNELAASITDKGDLQGRVGFFTSTGGQVGFDNLEINK